MNPYSLHMSREAQSRGNVEIARGSHEAVCAVARLYGFDESVRSDPRNYGFWDSPVFEESHEEPWTLEAPGRDGTRPTLTRQVVTAYLHITLAPLPFRPAPNPPASDGYSEKCWYCDSARHLSFQCSEIQPEVRP